VTAPVEGCVMNALPTPEETIAAFRSQALRPSGRIFFGWTGSGVRCACAIAAVVKARTGAEVASQHDAGPIFGTQAVMDFTLGWDNPGCVFMFGSPQKTPFINMPVSELGARCWWACVEAGLVPNLHEIPNSDIRQAPKWWRGESYESARISLRFDPGRV
jgi:hypothetical protein